MRYSTVAITQPVFIAMVIIYVVDNRMYEIGCFVGWIRIGGHIAAGHCGYIAGWAVSHGYSTSWSRGNSAIPSTSHTTASSTLQVISVCIDRKIVQHIVIITLLVDIKNVRRCVLLIDLITEFIADC